MKLTTILGTLALSAAAVPAAAHDTPGFGPFGGGLSEAERTQLAEERFTAADTDGDGQLTQVELVAAAEAAELLRREQRVTLLLEVLDANGDGTVSLEEAQTRPDSGERPGMRRHRNGPEHR